jgi:hypothetical protein
VTELNVSNRTAGKPDTERMGTELRWYPGWLLPLAIALVIGIGANAAPIPESPGRWEADPRKAIVKESDWILGYAVLQPQVGDRIPNVFFVALAENEQSWAEMYLDRQAAAIRRAASSLPAHDLTARSVATADLAVLEHDRAIVSHAGGDGIDPFALRQTDTQGMWLIARAKYLLDVLVQPARGSAEHSAAQPEASNSGRFSVNERHP